MLMQMVGKPGRGTGKREDRPDYDMARVMRLDGIDVREFARMTDSVEQGAIESKVVAISDARRFVRHLSARMPMADVAGRCTWSLTGDVLGEILPVFGSMQDVETAGRALRLVIGLLMTGETVGAGMQVRDMLLSMHGSGRDGTLSLTFAAEDATTEMVYGVGASGMERLR